VKLNPFNKKIGIALGGGAAKGLAHVGVLKAVEENKIKVSCISGTSVGAIIASYYAFGKELKDIEVFSEKLRAKDVFKLTLNKKGFLSTDSVRKMLHNDIGDVKIEQARIPLAICTTDIRTGESVIFKQGSLLDAVCASVAVPGIFLPVEVQGRLLVDGGISNNLPVKVLEQMGAGITIAVDLNGVNRYPEVHNFIDIIGNAIDIAIDLRTKEQLQLADIKISLDLGDYSRLDNSHQKDMLFDVGYEVATKQISRLFWYRRLSLFYYVKKALKLLTPIKTPQIILDLKKKIT
jgi:NTE family protein